MENPVLASWSTLTWTNSVPWCGTSVPIYSRHCSCWATGSMPLCPISAGASSAPTREAVAEQIHVPLQFDFVPGFGDDAGAIKLNRTGVPVTTLLVPARYTHTHNGIIDRADFDRTVDLLVALLKKLDTSTVDRVRSFQP